MAQLLPATLWIAVVLTSCPLSAQESSVRPGINDYYMDPEWKHWVRQFERPDREVFDRRFELTDDKSLLRTNYFLEFVNK